MNFFSADAYLFDIDGTLMNVRDLTHYYAFRNAIQEVFGFEASIDGVPVHGNTDAGILRAVCRLQGVSDQDFERELDRLIGLMSAEVSRRQEEIRPELCPSIPDLLTALHDKGKLIGIVTGNFEVIGWAKISASGLRKFFSFGAFSNHAERRADIFRIGLAEVHRRLGRNATTYIVGDTPADIEAAKELGVPIVSVATGTFAAPELKKLGPDLCLSCCTELLEDYQRQ